MQDSYTRDQHSCRACALMHHFFSLLVSYRPLASYEELCYATHAGGIDENSLRAFTLSMKGTPLLLGRGAARGADARWLLR